MPATQVTVTAQKPGFFNDRDTGDEPSGWIQVGPNSEAVVVKLIPQGGIYGRLTDGNGQPIEHMPLHLTTRSIRDGRKRLEPHGMMETDEDGRFRFASLMPGIYYLAAGPRQGQTDLVTPGEKQKSGFPYIYYPGVPDFASASPIQLSAGQQTEADLSINSVPVYQVSGSVSGCAPDVGVGFQVQTPAGDDISVATNFNMETCTFTLDNVPAGTYVLRAMAQSGLQPLRAEARINVAANVDNVRLALAPTISIPIAVRLDARTASGRNSGTAQRPPISVHLIPSDGSPAESYSTFEPGRGLSLTNIDFGSYAVELSPQPPWYVASANFGQTNVLTDDISIFPGQSYPMEIVLRDDSASLSGTVKSSGNPPARATIVVLPLSASKAAAHLVRGSSETFNVVGLAPGDYLVFALDRVNGLEYSNSEAMSAYASQAAHVTLTPGQKTQVSLDLIHVAKGN
jgi:hypothetical protein